MSKALKGQIEVIAKDWPVVMVRLRHSLFRYHDQLPLLLKTGVLYAGHHALHVRYSPLSLPSTSPYYNNHVCVMVPANILIKITFFLFISGFT